MALMVTFRERIYRFAVEANVALYGDRNWLRRYFLSRPAFYLGLVANVLGLGYLAFSFLYFEQ